MVMNSLLDDGLLDRIYEAALIPERWTATLIELARGTESLSAAMLLVADHLPPLWAASPINHDLLSAFAAGPDWYNNKRMRRMVRKDHAGFLRTEDFSTKEELLADYADDRMARAHLVGQVGTLIPLPTGENVLFTIERNGEMAPFSDDHLAHIDVLRPHLARAGMLALRLQLQNAQAATTAMRAIGIPAAVVSTRGRAIAVNDLFEQLSRLFVPSAFGGIRVMDPGANKLFQAALPGGAEWPDSRVRSIPVPAFDETDQPFVIHVIPLRREARDVFSQGEVLVVITSYAVGAGVPDDAVLRGLFDLSAAEAKLAGGLAAGRSVKDVAAERMISLATARSQLAQIFQKTGTHQQSELVALLKGAHPVVPQ